MLTEARTNSLVDAKIHKAEAGRLRRTERVGSRWAVIYPELKHVPLEEREGMLRAAGNATMTRWVAGVSTLLMVLTALWALLHGLSFGLEAAMQRPFPLAIFTMLLAVTARILCVRAILRR